MPEANQPQAVIVPVPMRSNGGAQRTEDPPRRMGRLRLRLRFNGHGARRFVFGSLPTPIVQPQDGRGAWLDEPVEVILYADEATALERDYVEHDMAAVERARAKHLATVEREISLQLRGQKLPPDQMEAFRAEALRKTTSSVERVFYEDTIGQGPVQGQGRGIRPLASVEAVEELPPPETDEQASLRATVTALGAAGAFGGGNGGGLGAEQIAAIVRETVRAMLDERERERAEERKPKRSND